MTGAAGRMVAVVLGLLLVLTYLLLRGSTPDALHERRLRAIDELILNQAALHRDVLRASHGLLLNYDPLVAAVARLREIADELRGAGVASGPLMERIATGLDEQEALAAALGEAGGDVATALIRYEAARRPATAAVVRSNRQFGPERVLQLVEDRLHGPEDDIAALVTREELEDITCRYRRIAGFDVETLNRKPGQGHEQREAAA